MIFPSPHAGGIGQPLSLLLKLNPLITELSLYDVVNALGVSDTPSHRLWKR